MVSVAANIQTLTYKNIKHHLHLEPEITQVITAVEQSEQTVSESAEERLLNMEVP